MRINSVVEKVMILPPSFFVVFLTCAYLPPQLLNLLVCETILPRSGYFQTPLFSTTSVDCKPGVMYVSKLVSTICTYLPVV